MPGRPGLAASLALVVALAALVGARGAGPIEAPGPGPEGSAQQDTTPRSEARLVSDVASVRPGEPFTLGLHVTLDEGWRTPWKNAGDVGSGLLATWTLPAGFSVDSFAYPVPDRFPHPPVASYGYSDEVVFLATITPPGDVEIGRPVRLTLSADYVVCGHTCIPVHAERSLELPVRDATPRASDDAALIRRYADRLPMEAAQWTTRAARTGSGFVLGVTPPADWEGSLAGASFFPADPTLLEHAADQLVERTAAGEYRIRLTESAYLSGEPERIEGILVLPKGRAFDAAGHRGLVVRAAVAEPDEWEQYVRIKRLEIGLPALAIAAARQDEVVFAAVSGVRTVDADAPVEVGDRFHIGSVTKPITAAMIARLVEDGRIGWETTPVDVWPDEAHAFTPELRRITVEQLLSHRAGMPAFESDEENATFEERGGESPREERARLARWLLAREASFPVGDHVYSNAGYGLVAAMAEAVTGFSWEQLVEREVFAPLEMRSCGFGWPASSGDQPGGHRTVEGVLQPHDLSDGYQLRAAIAPAGDIHCSIEDLVRFGRAHLQGLHTETGYLGQATFRKMHNAPHGEYALGWNIRPFGSHHLGSAGTFGANLIVFRDMDLVTAVATNATGAMTAERFSGIASHLYRRLGTPAP